MEQHREIKVWDPLVRVFHWGLVSAYLVAWLSEDEVMWLHTNAGYLMLALISIRILWGLIGTRYARFSQFVVSPSKVWGHLKAVSRLKVKSYVGHNPAGGWMIVAMIVALLFTGFSGMALYGAEEHAGPLASWFAGAGEGMEDFLEETHEFFANFSLFLVFVHVSGVVVESLLQRETLVRAMITGRKLIRE
jgi:cytochrome b